MVSKSVCPSCPYGLGAARLGEPGQAASLGGGEGKQIMDPAFAQTALQLSGTLAILIVGPASRQRDSRLICIALCGLAATVALALLAFEVIRL